MRISAIYALPCSRPILQNSFIYMHNFEIYGRMQNYIGQNGDLAYISRSALHRCQQWQNALNLLHSRHAYYLFSQTVEQPYSMHCGVYATPSTVSHCTDFIRSSSSANTHTHTQQTSTKHKLDYIAIQKWIWIYKIRSEFHGSMALTKFQMETAIQVEYHLIRNISFLLVSTVVVWSLTTGAAVRVSWEMSLFLSQHQGHF